jgi:hypothetical protein
MIEYFGKAETTFETLKEEVNNALHQINQETQKLKPEIDVEQVRLNVQKLEQLKIINAMPLFKISLLNWQQIKKLTQVKLNHNK